MGRLVDDNGKRRKVLGELSSNMNNFINELEVFFPDITYTSGKRNAKDRVGSHSDHSHHNTGNAIDLSAKDYGVYNFLMNDKKGLDLMARYNLGIIDETNPEIKKKTGATGDHFHIGLDSKFAENIKRRKKSLESNDDTFNHETSYVESKMKNDVENKTPTLEYDISKIKSELTPEEKVNDNYKDYALDNLYKLIKQKEEGDKLIEDEESAKELKEEIDLRKSFAKNITDGISYDVKSMYDNESTEDEYEIEEELDMSDFNYQLPGNQNIFNLNKIEV